MGSRHVIVAGLAAALVVFLGLLAHLTLGGGSGTAAAISIAMLFGPALAAATLVTACSLVTVNNREG